jgi:hypothetical protein
LGLILGMRADSGLVRAGADLASVTASFEPGALHGAVAHTLAEAGVEVEPGEPILIWRQIKADGGSKAFINDQPASVALLREVAPYLVEIHGQHDDRGLVNPRGHRALLDRYARVDTAAMEGRGRLGGRPKASWPRPAPPSPRRPRIANSIRPMSPNWRLFAHSRVRKRNWPPNEPRCRRESVWRATFGGAAGLYRIELTLGRIAGCGAASGPNRG